MMNPNRETPQDESDDVLDLAILATAAEPPPLEIKQRALESAAAFTPSSQFGWWRRRRHSLFVAASAALTTAAACVLAFFLMPSSSVGFDDVKTAVNSQSWIRVAISGDGQSGTMCLSPERQVYAFHWEDWSIFIDGRERARFEYGPNPKRFADGGRIVKTALSEEDTRLVSPVDHMSQGLWVFGTERVLSQERREVREGGKKWIEFDLVFHRGDMNLGTLRVDPQTRLPVYLLFRSKTDPNKTMRYDYTYTGDGPADIYALGVPAGTKIEDRMPPKDAARVFEGIAASRARIGDFRLVVAEMRDRYLGLPGGFIVWRKGDRWRIDMCYSESRYFGQSVNLPDGQGWGDPFIENLKLSWAGPLYLCDGRTVYQNSNLAWPAGGPKKDRSIAWERVETSAPRDLLSGEGRGMSLAGHVKIASLVYPDLSSAQDFEFDPRPPAMPGCVAIKKAILTLVGGKRGVVHVWNYFDPTKGYALVRVDQFGLPEGAPADPLSSRWRYTTRLEDFQQSPQSQQLPEGFWYPSTIVESRVDLDTPQKGEPQSRLSSFTVHYHFDFNAPLPDSLFAMDEASKPGK